MWASLPSPRCRENRLSKSPEGVFCRHMCNTRRPRRELHFPYQLGFRDRKRLRFAVVIKGNFRDTWYLGCPALPENQVISFRCKSNVFLYIRTKGGNEDVVFFRSLLVLVHYRMFENITLRHVLHSQVYRKYELLDSESRYAVLCMFWNHSFHSECFLS